MATTRSNQREPEARTTAARPSGTATVRKITTRCAWLKAWNASSGFIHASPNYPKIAWDHIVHPRDTRRQLGTSILTGGQCDNEHVRIDCLHEIGRSVSG